MRYFKMRSNEIQFNQCVFATIASEEKWGEYSWFSGRRILQEIETPIKYQLTWQGRSKIFQPKELEYLKINGGGILFHNRAKKIFESLTRHHTMYKSEIEYDGKKLSGPFYTMNLEILYPAMNLEKSEFQYYATVKDRISSVRNLVLSRQKLSQIPEDEHLFRLQEYTPITIIDEYGKNLIEEAKIIGVEFDELEVGE